ncbi:MAG TPA: DUF6496 domain-containing protein [Acetobacteraceae bacterium]|nr:DUF6496 domain-containing protein [Acetobacteraceae bacterium]
MPRKQSAEQKEIVGRVMHEFKHGELQTGRSGRKVRNPRQAVAIALHEAGASNQQTPAQNRRALKHTEQRERRGQSGRARAEGNPSRAELYEQAKRADIPGRSRMSKAELQQALDKTRH